VFLIKIIFGVIKQIYHVLGVVFATNVSLETKLFVSRLEFFAITPQVKYVFANTTAEGKKLNPLLRVSNLINHVTLRNMKQAQPV
jgi:hypothetical protein